MAAEVFIGVGLDGSVDVRDLSATIPLIPIFELEDTGGVCAWVSLRQLLSRHNDLFVSFPQDSSSHKYLE